MERNFEKSWLLNEVLVSTTNNNVWWSVLLSQNEYQSKTTIEVEITAEVEHKLNIIIY